MNHLKTFLKGKSAVQLNLLSIKLFIELLDAFDHVDALVEHKRPFRKIQGGFSTR